MVCRPVRKMPTGLIIIHSLGACRFQWCHFKRAINGCGGDEQNTLQFPNNNNKEGKRKVGHMYKDIVGRRMVKERPRKRGGKNIM